MQPLFVNVGNRTRFYFNMRLGVSESFANFDQARIMFTGPSRTSSIITWISKSRSVLGSQRQFASSTWFEDTDEGGPWVVEKLVLYDTNANGVLFTRQVLAQMADRVNLTVYVWTQYMTNCSAVKDSPCTASGGHCIDRQLVAGLMPMSLCSCSGENLWSDSQMCIDIQQAATYNSQVDPSSPLPQDMKPSSGSSQVGGQWVSNSSSTGNTVATSLRVDDSPPTSSVANLLQILGLSVMILFLIYAVYLTSTRLQAIKQLFFYRRPSRAMRRPQDSFSHFDLPRVPGRQSSSLRRSSNW
ncbi:hypothetical protein GUITHDRAFT_117935 [Guillardia theta CCMP2712]|uniref:Uncharacterized protein n=1 Tax=Guillardia theta (strain CCMP2712) TaxID=905079 RepID=L1IIJ0_GUITC|nr:hypothetical protein GUITHDRAFT_117935 [Guillardia theta CCMP2712]EKX35902.1 hypothetical protein GUITHDRAFT_117935 [Guillardia theta CCMP2712]|eukprot:XP_005822882.1 hypothetical protein GUITHDRAFT_117935 [Guillardia theta CCMP2712]